MCVFPKGGGKNASFFSQYIKCLECFFTCSLTLLVLLNMKSRATFRGKGLNKGGGLTFLGSFPYHLEVSADGISSQRLLKSMGFRPMPSLLSSLHHSVLLEYHLY